VCSPCPPGTYWQGGACVPCKPGTYSSGEASLECLPCTGGTRAPSSGQTYCSTCPEGCTSLDGTVCVCTPVPAPASPPICASGYIRDGVGSCKPCPPGTYWEAGVCKECQPGTYSSTEASLECLPCTGGTRTQTSGQTKCEKCQPNCYSYEGIYCRCRAYPTPPPCDRGYIRDGYESCKPCPPGTYWEAGVCKECQPGTYSSTEASLECLPCTGGTRTQTSGQTKCEKCQPNCYSYEGIYCRCRAYPTLLPSAKAPAVSPTVGAPLQY
jgi:hypothetical protein